MTISRRSLLIGLPLLLAGCATMEPTPQLAAEPEIDPGYLSMYAAIDTEPFPVPAVDLKRIRPEFLRQEVSYVTSEPTGTVIVDPNAKFAYFILGGNRAIRYGVGVGKVEAFNFQGEAKIARKAEWPHWTPTPDMIAREPERYGPYSEGLDGGSANPLGPRALYLHRDGKDTLYRLHGTLEPWTIGTKVSSGCVRLLNQDIIDLYRRVTIPAKAIVLPIIPETVA